MSLALSKQTWNIAEIDRRRTHELAEALNIPRLTAHLMMLRGVTSAEEAHLFLRPSISVLGDPFLLPDMHKAVERIRQAGLNHERIRIFGDYDVDGIAGTAVLLRAFRRSGLDTCDAAMPSRVTEGYGITPEHVEAARDAGVTLIITVDNGITAREAAKIAAESGIDLIVTDHHPPEGPLPDALAVINPKCAGSKYPDFNACGTAVAFHLARAFTGEIEDLDLVALGTITDIVPLRGENRVLAALGLEWMAKKPRLGLQALAAVADINIHEMTSEKVAFQLGPRLNAAGRISDSSIPLALLLTESADEAQRIAQELNVANDQRRAIEKQIFDDAVQRLEQNRAADQRSIVLASRDWHPGVVGIVAARLQTMYNCPVVLVAIGEDGIGRGSARSLDAFDMAGALGNCREHLIRFGGHAAAAGLAIVEDYVEKFRAKFEEEARRRIEVAEYTTQLNIDALVSFTEIDNALIKTLDLLEPVGCMNPPPLFCASGVTILPYSLRELQGGHLRMTLKQGPRVFTGVWFRMADQMPRLQAATQIDLAFSPRFNTWKGETTIQLLIKDIRVP